VQGSSRTAPQLTRRPSLFYVRQRRDLTSALSITPSYLRNDFSTAGLVTDYRDWQIPLGRRFRALKIWFVLRSYGASGLRAHIRDHIRLADLFHAWVCGRPDLFAVPTAPAFALTVLVVVPRGRAEAGREAAGEAVAGGGGVVGDSAVVAGDEELAAANRATREVYELINARGEIYLTSGVVNGIYAIRVVSGSPKTEEKYLRNAFEILVRTAEEVLAR
jgi:aromatic-L-amino-acid decarboxylase